MNDKQIKEVEEVLGYKFSNKELLVKAFTHCSASSTNSNQSLEFLGDSVLGTVISTVLYERFPKANEGALSRAKASIVSKRPLAALCRHYGFENYLILGAGERKAQGHRRDSIQEDLVEALIGAVFEDSGFNFVAARDTILRLFNHVLSDMSLDQLKVKDSKTLLQEVCQGQQSPTPTYEILSRSGPAHHETFEVSCSCLGLTSVSTGRSRRTGEQNAAKAMLELINKGNGG